MRDEVCRTYSEKLPERIPLSQQKEFKPVRNMVIREALKLSDVAFAYDDSAMNDEPLKKDIQQEDTAPAAEGTPHNVYEQAEQCQKVKYEASVGTAVLRMLHHMGNIFRENSAKGDVYTGTQMDRKRRNAPQEKRLALGHKADDHEDKVQQQTM